MIETKTALYRACADYIKERIDTAELALANNRDGLEDDSKSSAGDKFETSREMIQQEVIRNELLLADARDMKTILSKIDINQQFPNIQNGSLIITNSGTFFFAIGAGKIQVDNKDYFVISISSPLGQVFKDKKAGDKAVFNGKTYQIKAVY